MRTRCDSTIFAVTQAKAIAAPRVAPPQPLNDDEMQYWPAIIGAKRPTAWTPNDLLLACQLARDLALIKNLAADMALEGNVLTDAKGKKYAHPANNLVDQATRRIVVAQRALHVHANATSGRVDYQGQKNEAARDLASKIDETDDELLPGMHLN